VSPEGGQSEGDLTESLANMGDAENVQGELVVLGEFGVGWADGIEDGPEEFDGESEYGGHERQRLRTWLVL
jgi:hypothetical protein